MIKRRKAYTVINLLFYISTLSAIILFSINYYNESRESAKIVALKSIIASILEKQRYFFIENGSYDNLTSTGTGTKLINTVLSNSGKSYSIPDYVNVSVSEIYCDNLCSKIGILAYIVEVNKNDGLLINSCSYPKIPSNLTANITTNYNDTLNLLNTCN